MKTEIITKHRITYSPILGCLSKHQVGSACLFPLCWQGLCITLEYCSEIISQATNFLTGFCSKIINQAGPEVYRTYRCLANNTT